MDPEQAQLRPQARRMTAVATLARPVQHDINNLLTVVFANLELLKRTAAPGGPQRQLDRIQEATRRLDGSTRALLNLLRRPTGAATPLRLSEALVAIQPLLCLILPANGALTMDLPADDPMVRLDQAALEDALLAIAQETAESLPRGSGLVLTLTHRPGVVEFALRLPDGMALPALAELAEVARAAGGTAELAPSSLALTLPGLPPTA